MKSYFCQLLIICGAERFAPQPSSIYVAEKINEADAKCLIFLYL